MAFNDDSIFNDFDIHHTPYKTIDGHPIQVALIVPKTIQPGLHPVAINIHGGYLVTGHRTFAPFMHTWLLHVAKRESALILSADYRLLPSANGLKDVNSDLEDFWAWTRRGDGLAAFLSSVLPGGGGGHKPDLTRTLLVGGSAGGYGATQLALSHPADVTALVAFYPMVDLRGDFWVKGPPSGQAPPAGMPPEAVATAEELRELIRRRIANGEVKTEGGFEEFMAIGAAAAWRGMFWELFDPKGGVGKAELPLERIRAGEKLPPKVWVAHGSLDMSVPAVDSKLFAKVALEYLPDTEFILDIEEGKEHGYDSAWTEEEIKGSERLVWLTKAWLKG